MEFRWDGKLTHTNILNSRILKPESLSIRRNHHTLGNAIVVGRRASWASHDKNSSRRSMTFSGYAI